MESIVFCSKVGIETGWFPIYDVLIIQLPIYRLELVAKSINEFIDAYRRFTRCVNGYQVPQYQTHVHSYLDCLYGLVRLRTTYKLDVIKHQKPNHRINISNRIPS